MTEEYIITAGSLEVSEVLETLLYHVCDTSKELGKAYPRMNNRAHSSLRMLKSNAAQTFKANDIAKIYKFPSPSTSPVTISVITFGGGLFGNVTSSGVLTQGDVQAYWSLIGIPVSNHPKVIIIPIDGATNAPVKDQTDTSENTIDVSMIGGCCPTSNLTILLFIAPNSLSEFTPLILKSTSPVTVDGILYTPSIVSVSWGAPEIYYTQNQLTTINAALLNATTKGINICVSTGDEGSTDGILGTLNYVDFPASSPYVTACGGTTLVCPTLKYSDQTTLETGWSNGGGGISSVFLKPTWQMSVKGAIGPNRCIPDISLVADPSTGVEFIINGTNYVYGGTSIVSPAVAAYYACMNTNRFLLPSIYAAAAAAPNSFHDITVGSNGGYTAKAGYDFCTGFGSIAGDILTAQLLQISIVIVPVTGISVDQSSFTITVGQQVSITAVITPSNATNKNITWLSNASSVAIVLPIACPIPTANATACDNIGLVTGVSVGTATITATTGEGNFNALTTITVIAAPPPVAVTGISLNVTTLSLSLGTYAQLIATIQPATATTKSVTWSSSLPLIASVSTTGVVTANTIGSATITVKTVDGGFNASVVVTVIPILISMSFYPAYITMFTYTRYQSHLLFNPTYAKPKNISYVTSSSKILSVDSFGMITAFSPGTAVIYAYSSGKMASLTVYVLPNRIYYATKTSVTPIKTRTNYKQISENVSVTMRR